MPDYINKKVQNEIMFKCKIDGKLSKDAIAMFELQARKISNSYDWKNDDDREDAIAQAKADFVAYWKNYKINPMASLKLTRNLVHGEQIIVEISGNSHTYTAKNVVEEENDFLIGIKTNITIGNLHMLINSREGLDYWTSIHKVTKKIAFIDNTCYSNSTGIVKVNKLVGKRVSEKDNNPTVGISVFEITDPPSAFNFLTSMARNGLFKASKVLYSDVQKIMTPFSKINSENGGVFNV